MRKRKGNWITVLLIGLLLAGIALLLYPTFSNYWNSLHQTKAITNYATAVADLDDAQYQDILADARDYNTTLRGQSNRYILSSQQAEAYAAQLNVSGTGVMGYIEIPTLKVSLPIYHGTEDTVLQVAIGHIAGSSLPVGGKGTHCVLSGHRGLPSAKLFTNLDQLAEGDVFMLRVLDELLTYEVDQIRIVLPDEMEELEIDEDADYCTLVTCTPYGINTHRLLVRGHRIANSTDARSVRVTADAMQIEPLLVAPAVAAPVLLLLLVALLLPRRRRKSPGGDIHADF